MGKLRGRRWRSCARMRREYPISSVYAAIVAGSTSVPTTNRSRESSSKTFHSDFKTQSLSIGSPRYIRRMLSRAESS